MKQLSITLTEIDHDHVKIGFQASRSADIHSINNMLDKLSKDLPFVRKAIPGRIQQIRMRRAIVQGIPKCKNNV